MLSLLSRTAQPPLTGFDTRGLYDQRQQSMSWGEVLLSLYE